MNQQHEDTGCLFRPRDGRVVAGVAEGLGRYFGIDPILVRLALAVATLVGGAGLLAYGLAWLAIPGEPAPEHRSAPMWAAVLLVAFGALALSDLFVYGSGMWPGPFFDGYLVPVLATVPLLVIGLGVAILTAGARDSGGRSD
jgi:phage shock protein PspC (stress-responsive transcriptional regulator)